MANGPEGNINPLSSLIPERQGESTGLSEVDLVTQDLANFTPPGMPQPSDADLKLVNLMTKISPQEAGSAVGDIGRTGFFPGIDDPILKGVSGSQTLGSQPIFVGSGGFFPFEIIESRKRRMQAAAQARAEQFRAFDPGLPPEADDANFQASVNKEFDEVLRRFQGEAQQTFGDKWDVALQSQATDIGKRFQAAKDDLNTMVRIGNQITGIAAQVEKDIDEGTKIFSPNTHALLGELKGVKGRFRGGQIRSLQGIANELAGSMSIDKAIKDNNVIANITEGVQERLAGVTDRNDYDLIIKETRTSAKKQAKEIAQNMKKGIFAGTNLVSAQDIEDTINGFFEDSLKLQIQKAGTPQRAKSRAKKEEDPTKILVQDSEKFKVKNNDVTLNGVVVTSEKNRKPVKIVGAQIVNENGVKLSGDVQDVIISSIGMGRVAPPELVGTGKFFGSQEIFQMPNGRRILTDKAFERLKVSKPELANNLEKIPIATGITSGEKAVPHPDIEGETVITKGKKETVYMSVENIQETLREFYPAEMERFESEWDIEGYDPDDNNKIILKRQEPTSKGKGY